MGLKRNFLYNFIITSANYLFPLIVFPYVSRALKVYNLGICNFVDSIILYFTMLSMMGINILGIREIASVQNNAEQRSHVFSSLFFLNAIFTIISLIALFLCINLVPQFIQFRKLLYIGSIYVIANFLLIEWLYKGLEDFAYITKRTLLVKIAYIIAVFTFIHKPEDYILYYILTTLSVVINAAINLLHSKKYVWFNFRRLSISKYLKPYIGLGLYWVLTTIYASFYNIYLGFVSTPDQIGFFTTASKLIILTMSLYTAWTTVVMPRASAMLSNDQTEAFKELINKSTNALFCFSIPVIIIGCFFSSDIISLLAGKGYEGAIIPTCILMPLIFFIGYSQILIIQILMPLRKDKVLLRNSVIGAISGILLSLLIVPKYLAIGAGISWLVSETIVFILAMVYVQRKIHIPFPIKDFIKNILCNIPTVLICCLLYKYLPSNSFIRLFVAGIIILLFTMFIQITMLRNTLFISLYKRIITITTKQH